MKKMVASLFLLVFLFDISSAQITFNNIYFGNLGVSAYGGYNVQQTFDHGYVTIGNRGFKIDSAFVFKINQYGDSTWLRRINLPSRYNRTDDIINTSDSGLLLLANFSSNDSPVIVKLNKEGDSIWEKNINFDTLNPYSVIQAKNNDFIITGNGPNPSFDKLTNSETYISRISSSGTILWNKLYHDINSAVALKESLDGGLIACLSNGILKTDANGDSLWEKTYIHFNKYATEQFMDMVVNPDSGFTVIDDYWDTTFNFLGCKLIKTDSKGDTIWEKKIPGLNYAARMIRSSDGGYAICGEYDSINNVFLLFIKTDSNGIVQFARYYNSSATAYGIQNTSDGGYILSGDFFSTGSIAPPGIILIKTDGQGNVTGIPSLNNVAGGVDIYPNPVSQNLVILLKNTPASTTTIEVYNIDGQLVYSGYLSSAINTISFEQFAAGTYLATIKNGEGAVITKKFLKE